MTTPYREPGESQADVQRGLCPWCRAAVSFDASQPSEVCEHCGARFAPTVALTTRTEVAPVAAKKTRLGYYALLTLIAGGAVFVIPLIAAAVVAAAAFGFAIYVGFGLPDFGKKQLAPGARDEERDR